MSAIEHTPDSSLKGLPPWLIPLVVLLLALVLVGLRSTYALLTVITESLGAVRVLGLAALLGIVVLPFPRRWQIPLRWRLLIGTALGIGVTALVVLLFGLAGLLGWWIEVLILILAIAGAFFRLVLGRKTECSEPRGRCSDGDQWQYLLLLVMPFLALALLAASTAPGFLWSQEGFGYDVLEYHLQMPKEYFDSDTVDYAPHNVYANFPANVEMLYLLAMVNGGRSIGAGVTAHVIHMLFGVLAVLAALVVGCEHSRRVGVLSAIMLATTGWVVYLCGLAYVENALIFFGLVSLGMIIRFAAGRTDESGEAEETHETLASGTPADRQSAVGTGLRRRPASWGHTWVWLLLAGAMAGFACGVKYTAAPMIAIPIAVAILLLPARSFKKRLTASVVFGVGTLVTFAPWLIKNQIMTGNPVFPLANRVFQAHPEGWGEAEAQRWEEGHSVSPEHQTFSARLTTIWQHLPGDKYQRVGPALFILAIAGLVGRRRDRVDTMLLVILAMQLVVWILFTHLFARFAVVMLVPLSLFAGRSLLGKPDKLRTRLVLAVVSLGACWNFAFAAKLHAAEWLDGAHYSLFADGKVPGHEYFDLVNNELPKGAKVLLVGDARAFYFRKPVDYCVVFNRSPLADAVRDASCDAEVVGWLQSQDYTHVLVNWSELHRLASTYGLAPEINPPLFRRLVESGLHIEREYTLKQSDRPFVTVFEVPQP